MIVIKGKFNTAICFCDELEKSAESQIKALCNRPEFSASKIRIMPDVHAGKGCTIGTTMTISDKVVPNMVGVDIGCGVEVTELKERSLDFVLLDQVIKNHIPAGRNIRRKPHSMSGEIDLSALRCSGMANLDRAVLSIGTLGGGNHFIEVGCSQAGRLYITVHSGSRNIGKQTADFYQNLAVRELGGQQGASDIRELRRGKKGKKKLAAARRKKRSVGAEEIIPRDFAYLMGSSFDDYVHDMALMMKYADLNRRAMTDTILREMGLTKADRFAVVHNYLDPGSMILRKGAVSANDGERILIPINMRDGSLLCVGKGNEEWNFSAPHGAGRIMSRRSAHAELSMKAYREEMRGIFTSSVSEDTLDESPMAYKNVESIVRHIAPTAEIIDTLKPIYNFKAKE